MLGDVLDGEQGADHPRTSAAPRPSRVSRLRERRGEPGRRVARARRQDQQDAMTGQVRSRDAPGILEAVSIQCMFSTIRMSGSSSLTREEHVANRGGVRSLSCGPDRRLRNSGRRGDAEEVSEQDVAFLAVEAQELVLFGARRSGSRRPRLSDEAEAASQQVDDRTVRHGAAVGGAGRLQHLGFVSSCRAGTRSSSRDLPTPGSPASNAIAPWRSTARWWIPARDSQLSIAADQRRAARAPRHFQPGSAC